MERKENPKVDYTTTADCKDLHTQAVEVAENLRKSQPGKVYKFIPHPTLPKTWVRKGCFVVIVTMYLPLRELFHLFFLDS